MSPSCEQQLFIDLARVEMDRALRMIRRFPCERLDERGSDCGHSARELSSWFLQRARVIEGVVRPPFRRLPEPIRTHDLATAFEASMAEGLRRLSSYDTSQWNEMVPGALPGELGRRAELLWIALRDLRRHAEHFAIHLRDATRGPEAPRALTRSA
jgi:hypothetical protein